MIPCINLVQKIGIKDAIAAVARGKTGQGGGSAWPQSHRSPDQPIRMAVNLFYLMWPFREVS